MAAAPVALPLPPEVRAQAPPPAPPMPVMMQAGQQAAMPTAQDEVGMLEAKLGELKPWLEDTLLLVNKVHPPLKALLAVIANVAAALEKEIGNLRQRTAQPSPMMTGAEAMPPGAAGVPPAVGM